MSEFVNGSAGGLVDDNGGSKHVTEGNQVVLERGARLSSTTSPFLSCMELLPQSRRQSGHSDASRSNVAPNVLSALDPGDTLLLHPSCVASNALSACLFSFNT